MRLAIESVEMRLQQQPAPELPAPLPVELLGHMRNGPARIRIAKYHYFETHLSIIDTLVLPSGLQGELIDDLTIRVCNTVGLPHLDSGTNAEEVDKPNIFVPDDLDLINWAILR